MSTRTAATVRRRGIETAEQSVRLQPQPGIRKSCGHARRGTDAPAALEAGPTGEAIKSPKTGAGSRSEQEAKRAGMGKRSGENPYG